MSAFSQWVVTSGAKGIIKDSQGDGKVKELADQANKAIQGFFPDDPQAIKLLITQHIIFPFTKLFLNDEQALKQALKNSGLLV